LLGATEHVDTYFLDQGCNSFGVPIRFMGLVSKTFTTFTYYYVLHCRMDVISVKLDHDMDIEMKKNHYTTRTDFIGQGQDEEP